jgi:hypothetical protein
VDYSTFTNIRSAVQDELNRSDATDALVASFIRITEIRAYRSLRIPEMEVQEPLFVIDTGSYDASGRPYCQLPSRWLETITMTDTAGTPLEYVSQQYFRKLVPQSGTQLSYYTREGNNLLLYPTTEDQAVNFYYYQRPEYGDAATNNTPAIYATIGEALFFGSVAEGWRYFREEEKYAYYRSLFAELLEQLQQQHKQSDISGSTLISKNPYN